MRNQGLDQLPGHFHDFTPLFSSKRTAENAESGPVIDQARNQ